LRVHAEARTAADQQAVGYQTEEIAVNHRTVIAATLVAVAAVGGASATAAARTTVLTIHHQMRGCHTWSFDGKSWVAAQQVTLARGSNLKVVNDDVMSHLLVQLSGTKVAIASASMAHMGAAATVAFGKPGVYTFRTKGGADYTKNVMTMGPDNRLTLRVTVR
jgi:hypothetical protein